MELPNEQYIPEPIPEFKSAYTRAAERRERDEETNAKVIKPFKSTAGERELFLLNELVSVQETETEDGIKVFSVSGLAYNYKNGKVRLKVALFYQEQFDKYLKYIK